MTVTATLTVRKGLQSKKTESSSSFVADMKEGLSAVTEKKGVFVLVVMGSLMTLCLGFIQTLASPMVLSFANSAALGTLTSVIALGMLVSSVLLGGISIQGGYIKVLCGSLFLLGIFMAIFGLRENIWLMGISGFLFFAMLPPANASLDYLIRTNIRNELQGRAWGLIGFFSQIGYVVAYAASGLLADYLFTPLLMPDGLLARSIGKVFGTGAGRGIGFLITLAGGVLCVSAVVLFKIKSIQNLEVGSVYER